MTKEQFGRECAFQNRMLIALMMRDNKYINKADFTIIERKLREKYKPLIGVTPRKTA